LAAAGHFLHGQEPSMRILLPVDGSDSTKRMLGYIAAHDELFGPAHSYTVFTAVPSISGHATRFLEASVIADYYAEQAEEIFRPIRAFAAEKGWTIETVHVHGEPAKCIAAYVQHHAHDLIVMGAHGHTALVGMVLGSVANGVLARCKVPVLLIR
jgi:nucleotide-binding universal stress UspA family protein